ncbi:MAG: ankyrin repeat domain-containing protein [Gelidibacter sp.]
MTKSTLAMLVFLMLFAFMGFSCQNKTQSSNLPVDDIYADEVIENNSESKDASIPTSDVINAFYDAIMANDSQKVQHLLETEYPASYEPQDKITPLQAAIWNDNLVLVKVLVEKGAAINSKVRSAILEAAEYNRFEILEYLLENTNDIDDTAFNHAGFHQFYQGAKLLLIKGAPQENGDVRGKLWVFHRAVEKSDYEVLNRLHLSSDDFNYNDYNGETALIIAVRNGDLKMVEFLLDQGVDKNKPETFDGGDDIYYGQLPIQIAADKNFEDIIQVLK